METVETEFECVLIARKYGAKIVQQSDGLWAVLDKPGTVFWYAVFRTERTAAEAFVLAMP